MLHEIATHAKHGALSYACPPALLIVRILFWPIANLLYQSRVPNTILRFERLAPSHGHSEDPVVCVVKQVEQLSVFRQGEYICDTRSLQTAIFHVEVLSFPTSCGTCNEKLIHVVFIKMNRILNGGVKLILGSGRINLQ